MSRCTAPFCRCSSPCPEWCDDDQVEPLDDDQVEPLDDDQVAKLELEVDELDHDLEPWALTGTGQPVELLVNQREAPIPCAGDLLVDAFLVYDLDSRGLVEAGPGSPPFDGVRVVAAGAVHRHEGVVAFRWRFTSNGVAIAEVQDADDVWHWVGICEPRP